jgi:hypothetical protein
VTVGAAVPPGDVGDAVVAAELGTAEMVPLIPFFPLFFFFLFFLFFFDPFLVGSGVGSSSDDGVGAGVVVVDDVSVGAAVWDAVVGKAVMGKKVLRLALGNRVVLQSAGGLADKSQMLCRIKVEYAATSV